MLQLGVPWRREAYRLAPSAIDNFPLTPEHRAFVADEVLMLRRMHAIAPYDAHVVQSWGRPRAIAPIHVAQPDGPGTKMRLVVDLRYANLVDGETDVHYPQLADFVALIRPGMLLAKLDIRSGYHHIPMREADAPYLCMCWDGVIYYWHCLPFGLSSAPRWFCRFVEPAARALRAAGAVFTVYMDDFIFLLGRDEAQAHRDLAHYTEILTSFGWVMAREKQEGPATSITCLGYTLDSRQMKVSLSPNRMRKLRRALSDMQTSMAPRIPAAELARLAGYLGSASLALRYSQRLAWAIHPTLQEIPIGWLCLHVGTSREAWATPVGDD